MEGDEAIDRLMMPVLDAIKRHIKDKEAITDIYNRAYEAVMESMDAKEYKPSKIYKDMAKRIGQSDADKVLLLITAKRELEEQVISLEFRLIDLTGAIEDYLNDAREKPAWEKLEEAMNKLGMRR